MPYGDGVRAHYLQDSPENRVLSWWGGLVSATVEDYAAAIGCGPSAIVEAVESGDVDPLTDTSVPKGQRGSEEERPTDPELRSLCFCRDEFEKLVEAVGGTVPTS